MSELKITIEMSLNGDSKAYSDMANFACKLKKMVESYDNEPATSRSELLYINDKLDELNS